MQHSLFTGQGEHAVRVEDRTEDDAEDKSAYNSAHSESRENLRSADHHGHNDHTHGETTLPRESRPQDLAWFLLVFLYLFSLCIWSDWFANRSRNSNKIFRI
jgi:hypothetical protein